MLAGGRLSVDLSQMLRCLKREQRQLLVPGLSMWIPPPRLVICAALLSYKELHLREDEGSGEKEAETVQCLRSAALPIPAWLGCVDSSKSIHNSTASLILSPRPSASDFPKAALTPLIAAYPHSLCEEREIKQGRCLHSGPASVAHKARIRLPQTRAPTARAAPASPQNTQQQTQRGSCPFQPCSSPNMAPLKKRRWGGASARLAVCLKPPHHCSRVPAGEATRELSPHSRNHQLKF